MFDYFQTLVFASLGNFLNIIYKNHSKIALHYHKTKNQMIKGKLQALLERVTITKTLLF